MEPASCKRQRAECSNSNSDSDSSSSRRVFCHTHLMTAVASFLPLAPELFTVFRHINKTCSGALRPSVFGTVDLRFWRCTLPVLLKLLVVAGPGLRCLTVRLSALSGQGCECAGL